MLRTVDTLVRDHAVDDDTWAALTAHLDDRGAIELCLLAAHYEMLATTIAALRIQPDAPRSRRGTRRARTADAEPVPEHAGPAAAAGPPRPEPRRGRDVAAPAHARRHGRRHDGEGLRGHLGGRRHRARRRVARDLLPAVHVQGRLLLGGLRHGRRDCSAPSPPTSISTSPAPTSAGSTARPATRYSRVRPAFTAYLDSAGRRTPPTPACSSSRCTPPGPEAIARRSAMQRPHRRRCSPGCWAPAASTGASPARCWWPRWAPWSPSRWSPRTSPRCATCAPPVVDLVRRALEVDPG